MTARWVCALLAAAGVVTGSYSQSPLPDRIAQFVAYSEDSGTWDGVSDGPASVYTHTVRIVGAAWMRLFFSSCELPAGSFIRMTSLFDGEVQELDAAALAMWGKSSAYFNGDRVELEMVAGVATAGNRIVISRLEVEFAPPSIDAGPGTPTRGNASQCGICGADDRIQLNERWSCRLMPAGCTASVFTSNSCLISAGHCVTENLVAQFNVPNSTVNCTTINPPVADQFPIVATQQQIGGLGDDWSVLRAGTNSMGQRPFQRYGKLRRISPTVATVNAPVALWSYGADDQCVRSKTQQFSHGPITSLTGSTYEFAADVRTGSSGAGLIRDGLLTGVVTHCRVECPNVATRTDRAAFVAARAAVCPSCNADVNGDGVVDIGDLSSFLSMFGFTYPESAFNPAGDLNSDNTVDVADLSLLLSQFGGNCN